jgi:K+-transporting ATPase ATPase A chain
MRRHSDGCSGFLLIASFLLLLMVLARPLGRRWRDDQRYPAAGPGRHRTRFMAGGGIRSQEMNWCSICSPFCCLTRWAAGPVRPADVQGSLPLNPQHLPGLSWDLALNTAVSFVSNTNWQAYAGETTMSYLSQMAGLTVQNFLSAATGIAVIFALTRASPGRKSAPWATPGSI